MEITIKLTENELQKSQITGAVAQILGAESAAIHTSTQDQQICETPPWEDGVPPMNTEQKEPAAEEVSPEGLRSKIRQIGSRLTVEGKASKMLQVFKEFGVSKLSEIKDSDLAEVMKKVEALL